MDSIQARNLIFGWIGSEPKTLDHPILIEAYERRFRVLNKVLLRCEIDPETGCVEWMGPTSGEGRGGGYGRFNYEGSTNSVHRVVWSTVFGAIPRKKQIDHECENRVCCNLIHLGLTTHRKNQRLKGRRQ